MTTLLTAKFAQVDASILDIQTQIASLQTKLTALQDYRQQLQSVEQACQSALAQVGTALSMLNHVDPAEIGTFRAAVEAQFGTDAIAFLESATPTPAEPVKPEPTAPTVPEAPSAPDTEPAIDVQVTTDTPATDEPIEPAVKADIEILLNKMSLADIRKLAKAKGADARGNRVNIAARLKALVTESDVWDATA